MNMQTTSLTAYAKILPKAPTIKSRILVHLADVGMAGATCDECEKSLGLLHTTCSARINELADAGHIEDLGERRKTSAGTQAIVWFLTIDGALSIGRGYWSVRS